MGSRKKKTWTKISNAKLLRKSGHEMIVNVLLTIIVLYIMPS